MPERHPAGPLCRCRHRIAAHTDSTTCDGIPRDHGGCPCPAFRLADGETVNVVLVEPEHPLAVIVVALEDGRKATGWVVP